MDYPSVTGDGTGPGAMSTVTAESTETPLQRQVKHLNSQMSQLVTNLNQFSDHVDTMCAQYKSIEELGLLHTSLFMAVQRVNESEQDSNNMETAQA